MWTAARLLVLTTLLVAATSCSAFSGAALLCPAPTDRAANFFARQAAWMESEDRHVSDEVATMAASASPRFIVGSLLAQL